MPSAHQSTAVPWPVLRSTSGARYSIVPHEVCAIGGGSDALLGQPKVESDVAIVVEEHVFGLQVAVDDAGREGQILLVLAQRSRIVQRGRSWDPVAEGGKIARHRGTSQYLTRLFAV